MKIHIREAQLSDFEGVGLLQKRQGLAVEWCESHWLFLWGENPVMQSLVGWPIGWVLEENGRIVGYLGNIPLRYWHQGKPLLIAAARGYAVDPEFRGHSLKLIAAFFSQKMPNLLLNTTANQTTAVVFKMAGAEPIPYSDYDTAPFWIISGAGFLLATFKRLGLPSILTHFASFLIRPVLSIVLKIRGHGPRTSLWPGQLAVIKASEMGYEFDELWQRRQLELPRVFMADRSAELLRWHFDHVGALTRQAQVLVARQEGFLLGYMILTREDSPAIGLKRYRVADLFVEGDSPEIIDALLGLAYTSAKKDGVHTLEWIGFPSRVRARFMATAPLVRKLPSLQFWFKALDSANIPKLECQKTWYANSFDGDASL